MTRFDAVYPERSRGTHRDTYAEIETLPSFGAEERNRSTTDMELLGLEFALAAPEGVGGCERQSTGRGKQEGLDITLASSGA